MPRHPIADAAASQFWDAHALDYAHLFVPLMGRSGRSMVSIVQDCLPSALRALYIACGPGNPPVAAEHLCTKLGAGSILATGISPAMVALTEHALAPIGVT